MAAFRPQDAEGILTALVDASDDAVISHDLQGVISSWNPAAERLYGYTADEVIGRPGSVIVPDDRRDELGTLLKRIAGGLGIDRHETVRQAKDGRRVDVSLTVTSVRDASGQVVGAVTLARDLTARKRADAALRASELRWRSVFDSAVDGIIVIDARGCIEAFNPAAERLFGYAERDVRGRNVNMLMPSPYHEEHDQYLARYLETGEQKIIGIGREVIGLRQDGTTFPVHLSVAEMTVGGARKFTGILHDLSARVRIEEQLREQTALARLGEMAAVIAHEVKNPLAGVRGAIQVIGSRLPKDSKDAAMTKEIVARIDGLDELMQDLLLFARPPRPKPAPVELAALVRTTADLLSSDPAFQDVQLTVVGSAPPILADAALLKIVFENLLVNAAQAMRGRGTLRISLSAIDDSCQIVVSDSGPGIPAEVREKVFTPFFTTKSRGSGLGLPTAKRLVEAHGGDITLVCPPEGGTIVTISLPAPTLAAL